MFAIVIHITIPTFAVVVTWSYISFICIWLFRIWSIKCCV